MANYVVISGGDDCFRRWGRQYAAAGSKRFNIDVGGTATFQSLQRAVEQAAITARGGWVIFNVGHGGSSGHNGMIDLGPSRAFRITSGMVLHRTARNPEEQRKLQFYLHVGSTLRRHDVTRVVFLSCRLGNATDFVDRIATDWGMEVLAYRPRIACTIDGDDLARIHFGSERVGQGTATEAARTRFPLREQRYYYIGQPGSARQHVPPAIDYQPRYERWRP